MDRLSSTRVDISTLALPSTFLEALRARVSLPDFIGKYAHLEKAGKQWKGCCPFHRESTPSFYVYVEYYHCFGCGKHGDVINFLMEKKQLDFREAVFQLAKIVDIPLPAEGEVWPSPKSAMGHFIPSSTRDDFGLKRLEAVTATAAKILIAQSKLKAAHFLANTDIEIIHAEHDNWNGGQDHWTLKFHVQAEAFVALDDREKLEQEIEAAMAVGLSTLSTSDFVKVEFVARVEHDPHWRNQVLRHTAGEGVSNQGRVRSDNIATKEIDGLLFRSTPEINFHKALKRLSVPFMPLPVVLRGGSNYQRIEPDIVIFI